MYRTNLLVVSMLFLMIFMMGMSCEDSLDAKRNIESYYYPVDALEAPLVYEYQAVNSEELPPEYWYHKTVETDTAYYFTGTYYDGQFIGDWEF